MSSIYLGTLLRSALNRSRKKTPFEGSFSLHQVTNLLRPLQMIETIALVISIVAMIIALYVIGAQYHLWWPQLVRELGYYPNEIIASPTSLSPPMIQWVNGQPPSFAPTAYTLHLITQWYTDSNPQRQAEIDYCIQSHLTSPFDQITLVISDKEKFPWTDTRFRVVISPNPRPTFGELFQIGQASADANTVTVIANSDIVFTQTAQLLRRLPISHAVTLARWNVHSFRGVNTNLSDSSLQHDPFGSQDVWAIRGSVSEMLTTIPFAPGVMGCDHALGFRLMQAGYQLFNPALTIRTYHVHTIDTRQAVNKQSVPEPGVYIPVCSW